jgi:hypothetical protein
LTYKPTDPHQLRKDVVNLVLSWLNDQEVFIMEFMGNYETALRGSHQNMSFEQFIRAQFHSSTFAEEPFITATSCLLGVPIHITSNQSAQAHPFTVCMPWLGDLVVPEVYNHPPIIRGLINGLHFQSLLPRAELSQPSCQKIINSPLAAIDKGKCPGSVVSLSKRSASTSLGDWITVGPKKQRKKSSPRQVPIPAAVHFPEAEKSSPTKIPFTAAVHPPEHDQSEDETVQCDPALINDQNVEKVKLGCKVCLKLFSNLLMHLSKRDSCREAYDYESMKARARKESQITSEKNRIQRDRSQWEKDRPERDRDRSQWEKDRPEQDRDRSQWEKDRPERD